MKTFTRRNTLPLPKGRGLETYALGANHVPAPSPVLLVDRKNATTYLVPRAHIEKVLSREAARKPKKAQYKRIRPGA